MTASGIWGFVSRRMYLGGQTTAYYRCELVHPVHELAQCGVFLGRYARFQRCCGICDSVSRRGFCVVCAVKIHSFGLQLRRVGVDVSLQRSVQVVIDLHVRRWRRLFVRVGHDGDQEEGVERRYRGVVTARSRAMAAPTVNDVPDGE
jgi:hypothetical protein